MTTLDNVERGVSSDEAVFPPLLENIVGADRTAIFRRRAGHSHKLHLVRVFACSKRPHRTVFVSLRNSVERILDNVNLEDSESDFVANVAGIALSGGHLGSAWGKRRYGMRTGRWPYGAHRGRVSCVQTGVGQVAHDF